VALNDLPNIDIIHEIPIKIKDLPDDGVPF
jgi:hypothetical protein